jgi:peptidylprolyl isomerase
MNEVCGKFFTLKLPTRSRVEIIGHPKTRLVEIDVIAWSENRKMSNKTLIIVVAGLIVVAIAIAQTIRKPSHSAAGGPAKVSGPAVRTPDGLEYWDIKVGTGAKAISGETVRMHYTGWLTNGTKFDSSGDTPFSFDLGAHQVIKGWDEGIPGMRIGGKRQLRIPPDLAYGDRGAGGVIPPNATLIIDVELVGIQ